MTALLHPDARLVDGDTGRVLGGPALGAQVEDAAEAFHRDAAARRATGLPAGMILALTPTRPDAVVCYLGALAAERPVALLDPRMPRDTLLELVGRFAPALVTGVADAGRPPEGYRPLATAALGDVWSRTSSGGAGPHPDLGLLLTTSGSTGNPKLVRLARSAVLANAESIAQSLGITGDDVAVTTLPLFYTYGLSVLNSHLRRGATVLLEQTGLMQGTFWEAVRRHGVTGLAGVPYQYEMLRRLRFDPGRYPALRTLTQAGGRLNTDLTTDFAARMTAVGGRLCVMYGQTEATARMTVLPPERLMDKLGSAGLPVPGGQLSVCADGTETRAPGVTGEIVYRGPNVMMGYAETAADLARRDELGGVLRTGDLGHLDDEGFLYLTGRLKRMGKVFGVRVNLDDVERSVAAHGPVAAVAGDDRIRVFVEGVDPVAAGAIRAELANRLATHSSGLEVRALSRLPLLPTGKVDYRALEELR